MTASSGILAESAALLATGGLGAAAMKLIDTLIARRRSPEQRMGEAAGAASELIELALKASGSSVEQMLGELAALRDRLETLETSHAECEARCEALTGALRQADQKIDSLVRQLRDPAATAPGGVLAGALIELSGEDVRVIAPPAPTKRTRRKS